ncbi:methyl-coenzyme M reductase family protein [Methanonatronarchaeum sp. AMET-Sl]|uniref:methyl-coenzyme M reductase family protein n=1 Tax=Methanonatronarchaeum sp. AMET-Sl TaxID=3037654 RepID=UPI00244E4C76|nr:methyl-coenzyme M reductase family protein [Methanonatronarchaeum sp. AMET-Sl]WGI16945.1 methyl-coenzyme M reductase family protein [Methanonatronarchaeum sp. AMET-Sl]
MYEFLTYQGGVYKSNLMIEKIEDLGGYIIQKNKESREITMLTAIPQEDVPTIEELASQLKGKIFKEKLIGTEIAVVSPSISRHHLPHPVCDIAERLRRAGALTNIVSIARGVGRRISQITKEEETMIEEYDAAVFILGNFGNCLVNHKHKLLKNIKKPVIAVGAPEIEELENADKYIPGVGRKVDRMRKTEDQEKLDEIADALGQLIEKERQKINEDPLTIHPLEIKEILQKELPLEKHEARHSPIVLHLDGLRIKLPYDEHIDLVKETKVGEKKLSEIAKFNKSKNEAEDILLQVLPKSIIENQKQQKNKIKA